MINKKLVYIICSFTAIAIVGSIFSNNVMADDVNYDVTVAPSIMVSVPTDTVTLNLNPFVSAFGSTDLAVTVGTNNPTGYTLTMSPSDDTTTSLTRTGGTETIPTLDDLSGGYTEQTFTTNKWGYKLSSTNYLPFATSNEIAVTDAPSNATTSTVTFATKADTTLVSGAYNLEITFTAVANYVPPTPFSLYNSVAVLSKGKNTDANSHFSWVSISEPTSTDPAIDTSSSGVFEWDGKNGGAGIDSNGGSQKIYFYRGILETSEGFGSYGSDGSANAYPNYVKLSNDTCWRIVRTTSTGGVKMIYNGMWNSSTNTCANANTKTQLTTSKFNDTSATVAGTTYNGLQYQNIHAIGYTYSNLAASTTTATPISTIFGASGDDIATNTNSSIIKQYIESWYSANMSSYTNKLEGDAGYCNDRSLNEGLSWTVPLADSDTIIPYGTTGLIGYYFGSRLRNANQSTFSPILTCPRGKVDLYSYSGSAGSGNGQLVYPVALLTSDEASLAGNGYDSSYNTYNDKSYLRSNLEFWLLSPSYRDGAGRVNGSFVGPVGNLWSNGVVNSKYGVRPVISLSSDTTVLGSGTATDPWVVQ